MKQLSDYKFSKIGTNPSKYLENFKLYINNINLGDEINIKDLVVYHEGVNVFECKSATTFRQNIDAWLWMNFIIKKNEKTYIKIVDFMNDEELLNHSKNSLLLENKNNLIDSHRKTIIIKLLSLKVQKSCHPNYTFDDIEKECGAYERELLKDENFIKMIKLRWGI